MLTVKHVMPSGHEEIYSALRAGSILPSNSMNGPRGQFHIEAPSGKIAVLGGDGDGIFYVMNDNGKTVGKYDFGGMAVAEEPAGPKVHSVS